MVRFNVTFEIVTQESAEHGDADERGFIEQGCRLRDALDAVRATRTCHVAGVSYIEPSDSGPDFSAITIGNGMEYLTGAYESRAIHIPPHVSNATRARIYRLVRA